MESVINLHIDFYNQKITDPESLQVLEAENIKILNGFHNNIELVRTYYREMYKGQGNRIVFCGINPGKNGAGKTGIPFIDFKGLSQLLPDITNQDSENSAQFIMSVISEIGAEKFHDCVYMTNLSWFGFTRHGSNINYYELPKHLQATFTDSFIDEMDLVQPTFIVPLSEEVEKTLKQMTAEGRLKHPLAKRLPHPYYCSIGKNVEIYRKNYVDLINEYSVSHKEIAKMKFIDYLKMRHTIKLGERQIKELSAEQYNNRLINLQKRKIYNGELTVTDEMQKRIDEHYKDASNNYPRAIKYYIEFVEYSKQG
ncbi:uracil-DNA glycosylase family protein [Psychrobacillus sp. L4]|uniref:uracil-DNA glycosylase family protein n=1 Tax=Psychrobacillus sp. L4 TaxID=3236892 RepID=UPI0036F2F65D